MIIKLAALTEEEEAKVRKNLASTGVKSNQAILNFTHPGVILGGATGAFAGSEVGDKLFGGRHIDELYKTVSHSPHMGGETILKKITPNAGLLSRYGKNLFRGGMGTLGAGLGAMAVMKYRNRKDKQK